MSLAAVNLETLRGWLDEGKPVTVVDVRPVAQRSEWSIPGSLHVDAYEALKAHDSEAMSEIQLPLDRPVVTVCGMGRVSAVAARQLRDRGYEALSLGILGILGTDYELDCELNRGRERKG
jgi:rhodanese-related sulfurtransferase